MDFGAIYTVKKVTDFPRPQPDCHLPNSAGPLIL